MMVDDARKWRRSCTRTLKFGERGDGILGFEQPKAGFAYGLGLINVRAIIATNY